MKYRQISLHSNDCLNLNQYQCEKYFEYGYLMVNKKTKKVCTLFFIYRVRIYLPMVSPRFAACPIIVSAGVSPTIIVSAREAFNCSQIYLHSE